MDTFLTKNCETIPQDRITTVSRRYKSVTHAINQEFWNSSSDTAHSFYVGSYGRGTAIDTSDIDILVELPQHEYERFDYTHGNGQSRLLQAVRSALLVSYPRSEVRADGQIVKINFSDGILFEILPAFQNINYLGRWDGTYNYPDTNMGGNWKSTNPKAEQNAMKSKNKESRGLLYDTCKYLRRVRDTHYSSYHLSGIVIDSFVYIAMAHWHWLAEGETSTEPRVTYAQHLLNAFNQRKYLSLTAPGSQQLIDFANSRDCLEKVLMYI